MLFTSYNGIHTIWVLGNWQQSPIIVLWWSVQCSRLKKKFVRGPTNKLENRLIQNQKTHSFFIHTIHFLAHTELNIWCWLIISFSSLLEVTAFIQVLLLLNYWFVREMKSLRLITSRSRTAKMFEEMGRKTRKITMIVSDLMWTVYWSRPSIKNAFFSLSSTQLRDRIHMLVNFFLSRDFFLLSKSFGQRLSVYVVVSVRSSVIAKIVVDSS